MTGSAGEVRRASLGDVPVILALIGELAAYEREPEAVHATEADLRAALFPADTEPLVHCHVAVVDGAVVGLALWYVSFSTWEGRHGLYLEDLYVRPSARGAGLGGALLAQLAAECVRRGYPRLEWAVLDWNTPARRFYAGRGAQALAEWIPYRISGDPLTELAARGAASA